MRLNVLKTSIFCAVLLGTLASFTANAQSVSTTSSLEMAVFPAAAPLKLWVVLAKPATARPTQIELLDAKNQALYGVTLSKKEQRVRQLFDMSAMTDGVYKVRVITGNDVVEKVFQLKTPALREELPQRLLTLLADDKVIAGM
jgi:hypothetical protein